MALELFAFIYHRLSSAAICTTIKQAEEFVEKQIRGLGLKR